MWKGAVISQSREVNEDRKETVENIKKPQTRKIFHTIFANLEPLSRKVRLKIEVMEKSDSPDRRNQVVGLGGWIKASDLHGPTLSKAKFISKLQKPDEEKQGFKGALGALESPMMNDIMDSDISTSEGCPSTAQITFQPLTEWNNDSIDK